MKPGRRDIRHKVLVTGDELRELKRHTGSMAEAFGLDRKIENYKGTRPLTLYRWDLDCLMDVIDLAFRDERDYQGLPGSVCPRLPGPQAPGGTAAPRVRRRVRPRGGAVDQQGKSGRRTTEEGRRWQVAQEAGDGVPVEDHPARHAAADLAQNPGSG